MSTAPLNSEAVIGVPRSAPLDWRSRRRRVLFVDHTALLGGGEIALLNLVRHVDRRRYTPVVLLFSDGPLVQRLRDCNVETHVLLLSQEIVKTRKDTLGISALLRVKDGFTLASFSIRLALFINRNNIDLVHTNSLKADIIGGVAARLSRRPLVWHIRDRIADDYLPAAVVPVLQSLSRLLPDHVVANSAATLRTVVRSRNRAARTIHSGVEIDGRMRVVHDGTDIADSRTSKINSAAPSIGLVGRVSPWKGQHIFLQAAATVLQTHPGARFHVIGGPLFSEEAYDATIRKMVVELGIEKSVEFTGFVNDVPQRIARLDMLVHASTVGEPFGQVVIEGMAASKPVVATDGGGVPEIVIDGVTGHLVPMGNADAMALAINRILANPDAAAAMGAAGRARVLESFTINLTAARVQALYDEIFEVRRPIFR